MYSLSASVTALGVFLCLATTTSAGDLSSMLDKKTYTDSKGNALPYRLLKPESYDAAKKYPLVLFLHGAGERGDDNEKTLIHGVAEFAKDENRRKYPCFVLVPQCPENAKWVEVDWSADTHDMPKQPSEPMRLTLEVLHALEKEFSIDRTRIYVTGLSMGGYGTWDLLAREPNLFAAGVPICGGGDEKQAAKIAKIPVWAFHGGKDGVVKPARSRRMIEAIKKAGGNPKYTEYENVGHDSGVQAYKDSQMMGWLFSQKKEKQLAQGIFHDACSCKPVGEMALRFQKLAQHQRTRQ